MSNELSYEININIADLTFNDIVYLSFIRTPIAKLASFSICKINLPPTVIKLISNDISQSIFPRMKMSIFSYDESKKEPLKLVISKEVLCFKIDIEKPQQFTGQMEQCILYLVDPILYDLGTLLTFNSIHYDKKAIDVLNEFENHIKTHFGDFFNFLKIGVNDDSINIYKYEQMLIRSKADLYIPEKLLLTYKALNNFSFYFFDEFYFDNKNDKPIACHLINIKDPEKFTKFDIYSGKEDMKFLFNKLYEVNSGDVFKNLLNKQAERIISNTKDGISIFKKDKKETTIVSSTANKEPYKVSTNEQEREFLGLEAKEYKTKDIKTTSTTSIINVPDDIEIAQTRLENARILVKEIIYQIVFFEIGYAQPNFINFGYIYNIDEYAQDIFSYSPISIVNIFHRKSEKSFVQNHIIKTAMIKYTF